MISRILLSLVTLALASFIVLSLIGLWDRYSQETERLGFSGIYERYLAAETAPMPQASTTAEAAAFEE